MGNGGTPGNVHRGLPGGGWNLQGKQAMSVPHGVSRGRNLGPLSPRKG